MNLAFRLMALAGLGYLVTINELAPGLGRERAMLGLTDNVAQYY